MQALLRVCDTLNKNNVNYLIIGAYACALHGHIRATQDVDILLETSDKNINFAIKAMHELLPNLPEKITIADIKENVVLKLIDEIEIDLSTTAWSITYQSAVNNHLKKIIDGIEVKYLSLDDLIQSKDTLREIDMWDVKILLAIKNKSTN